MTAILRAGAELKGQGDTSMGYTGYQSLESVTGTYDPNFVQNTAPGRTGGRMWKCPRPIFWNLGNGIAVVLKPTHSNPARIPLETDGMPLVGRFYFKVNKYPAMTGSLAETVDPTLGQQNGLCIGNIGPGYCGVHLAEDGRLGFAPSPFTNRGYQLDRDLGPVPLNQWVMVEMMGTWSLTAQRRQVLRITMPGQDPVIAWCRMHIGPNGETPTSLIPRVEAGICFSAPDPGSGFVIDVDDIGMNLSDGGPHSTWLGPGESRIAFPNSDRAVGDPYVSGGFLNLARGIEGRTIPDHNVGTPPLDANTPAGCPSISFWPTLANNPVKNPAIAPSGRCGTATYEVSSSGSDFHRHSSPPPPTVSPSGTRWVWVYGDWPRLSAPGEILELGCNASDQSGAICFGMAYVIGTQGMKRAPFTASDGTGYMAFFTSFDGAAPTVGNEADRAIQNMERDWRAGGDTDGSWTKTGGRLAQSPSMGTSPSLYIRREDASPVTPEGADTRKKISEFRLLGAGIAYESGYVAQPALPTECDTMVCLL